jgi:hypothetical protein
MPFVRRWYVNEHNKYVWCIYNQATGSFQPEQYVEVMGGARHVDFCSLLWSCSACKTGTWQISTYIKYSSVPWYTSFPRVIPPFPYYNEFLLACYPLLVCFEQRMTCACTKRVPFQQISQRGYRYGYAPWIRTPTVNITMYFILFQIFSQNPLVHRHKRYNSVLSSTVHEQAQSNRSCNIFSFVVLDFL